jgi:formylglycine-generating enzyme required for sulfatase activity/predicted esterase
VLHRDLKPANIMVTTGGHVKIMDFGLAKLLAPDPGEESQEDTLAKLTQPGSTLGTLAYMSPEQLRQQPTDARSDIFSFGIVLHELLTGKHPFLRATPLETASAILHDVALPPSRHLDEAPREIDALVARMLAADPDKRFQSAGNVLNAINAVPARQPPASAEGARRFFTRPMAATVAAALVLLMAGALYLPHRTRQNLERSRALLSEMEPLAESGRYVSAYELAIQAEKHLPEDPRLAKWLPVISDRLSAVTEPAGADVYLQQMEGADGSKPPDRVLTGTTPIVDLRIPRAEYRAWLEKEGFATLERLVSSELNRAEVRLAVEPDVEIEETLLEARRVPDGMVFVPGGEYALVGYGAGRGDAVALDDYFVDRYEVSNEKYRELIRAGGYSKPEYWQHAFVKKGEELTFEEAMDLFKDESGLPGPRGWSNQEFPEGRADHPVTGVSWYEAAAYAEFAGKALPSIHQWERAARAGRYTHFEGLVMPWGLTTVRETGERRANFLGRDTVPVTHYPFGVSPHGAYNMAGNVEEWCLNEKGPGRVTAGGSWADAPYQFAAGGARAAFDASSTIGFRCVSKTTSGGDQGSGRLERVQWQPSYEAVDEATFAGFLSHYRYEDTDRAVERIASVETADWIREKLAFEGIDRARVIAYLFLPRRARPPYQCIYYLVSSTVARGRTADREVEAILGPQIKAGRAVMAVVPWGFRERERTGPRTRHDWDSLEYRDRIVRRTAEFRMGLDYLETRADIDTTRIAHTGFSWGATVHAIVLLAVEPRIRSSVFIGGGIHEELTRLLPEVNPVHFAPRIGGHKLVLTGKYDEEIPYEPAGRLLFELLREPKRLELVESGHLPPTEIRTPIIKAFLDETLGPVEH